MSETLRPFENHKGTATRKIKTVSVSMDAPPAGYAVWLLIEDFNGNGSPGGDALLLAAGLILLAFSAVIFTVGIKWGRTVKKQK